MFDSSKLKGFGIDQPITDFFWWTIEQIPQGGINHGRRSDPACNRLCFH
jgi:hypothetical protein